jgi:hypothetical protein
LNVFPCQRCGWIGSECTCQPAGGCPHCGGPHLCCDPGCTQEAAQSPADPDPGPVTLDDASEPSESAPGASNQPSRIWWPTSAPPEGGSA